MERYRTFIAKMGRKKAVLYTTLAALILALFFTGFYEIVMHNLGFGVRPVTAIIVAVAVTLTITPFLSWNFIGIFLRLYHLEEKMRNIAQHDQLTGLLSKHEFYERAKLITEFCRREDFDFTVAFLDLDNFKEINDTHGHLVGDDVLKRIGKGIKDNIRDNDLACRFGGDEFLLLFPNVSIRHCNQVLTRIERIVKNTYRKKDNEEEFGISLGLASYSNVKYDGIDSIIAAADYALYKAKEKTENNIHLFNSEDAKILYNSSWHCY